MKRFSTYEQFVNEHHVGLKNFNHLSSSAYTEMWKNCKDAEVDYLKKKGLSKEVIAYWTRPETPQNHQENIQMPFVYNEAILGEVEFKFEEGFIDVKFMYPFISKKTAEERERKWTESIQKGTDYFKGHKVQGNTPEERKDNLENSTRKWLSSREKSKPICVMKPRNENSWIIVDGGHRLWCARKLFPEGIELYVVKVTEK